MESTKAVAFLGLSTRERDKGRSPRRRYFDGRQCISTHITLWIWQHLFVTMSSAKMNKQQVIIDLCCSSSSSDNDDDHDDEHDIRQPSRRKFHTATATTTTTTTATATTNTTTMGNGKRARMAAAAEARMQEMQQHEPPRKQPRRPENHHHHHHVAETFTTTASTTTSKPSAACTATRKPPPPPGAVAAAVAAGVATVYISEQEPLVFLNAHARDNAIVTTGIVQELAKLHPNVTVATCCDSSTAAGGGGGGQQTSTRLPSRRLTLHHVQQPDQWSCGFRNLQMLLFALVPQLEPNHHAYFHFHPGQNGGAAAAAAAFAIPCLPEIEQALEAAWSAGLDGKGREHYHGKIAGKRAWVGAVEIWSVLTYWSLDACVVQFIRTPASRRQLGRFLHAYFTKQHYHHQQQQHDQEH
jgi:Peptidase family C78